MNVPSPGSPTASNGAPACFHCGEPIRGGSPFRIRFDGEMHPACCAGCVAVADTIIHAGLADYYRARSALPHTPAEPGGDRSRAFARYDLPGVRDQYAASDPQGGGQQHATLMLAGVTCPACLWLAERRLRQLPGVCEVTVNYATHRAEVHWQSGTLGLARLVGSLDDIGLTAFPAETGAARQAAEKLRKRALWELFVAAFAMMQVMMYTVPMYFADPGEVTDDVRGLMQWAGFVLTIPVMLFSARPLLTSAWHAIRAGVVNMDVPVSLAILLTFFASTRAMLQTGGEVYFDSISMFVFLLLGTRYLETGLRQRGMAELERLAHATPATACRLTNYPTQRETTEVASAALEAGDVILVDTGGTVPADGVLLETGGDIDESLMTGESRPVRKEPGDMVIGGSLNTGAPLLVEVTRVGVETVLNRLIKSSETALGERPAQVKRADAIAARMALFTLLHAAITGAAWLAIDASRALNVTVAVLAITCPCALALAVPAALTAATGQITRSGLIIRRGGVLGTLARVTDVVLDKTGTLTTGHLQVERIDAAFPDMALAIAAALEAGSPHPIARAIVAAAHSRGIEAAVARNIAIEPRGLSGQLGGSVYRIGPAPADVAVLHEDASITRVALYRKESVIATFRLRDELRSDAYALAERLRQTGIRLHVLSGDSTAAVAQAAGKLGIAQWHARLMPAEKQAYVQQLQRDGGVVLAIGDGVNDAPVLAQSDCGIAIAAGADLARARADAVLIDSRLVPVAGALATARKTSIIIRQNLVWAVLYNACAIPAAASGLIAPVWAALGMSLSSFVVIVNSMRAARPPRQNEAH
jgi:Cu2+-exporting ATPase